MKPSRREWDKAAERLILRALDDPKILSPRLEAAEEKIKWLTDWIGKQRRFLQMIEAKDFAAFEQLMKDPELRRALFESLTHDKRRAGRQLGQSPLPERVQEALPIAAAERPIIRDICRKYGIRYSSEKATNLLARRHNLPPKQLISYEKNKARRHK
jgi:hypothetical protein